MAKGQDFSAYETITVSGTAGGLTAATISGKSSALITVEVAAVRFHVDGSTPTATVGHVLEVNDVLELDTPEVMSKASFIRKGGTSGTLRCSYGD